MLVLQAQPQRFSTIVIQGKQIEIVIRSAVQHPPSVVNRGVNKRVNRAAIFGLHVKYAISESDVRVVAKKHDAMITWLGPVLAAGCRVEYAGSDLGGTRPEYFPEHLTGGVSLAIITLQP